MRQMGLDVLKWTVILLIAGLVFYAVCPKYDVVANGLMKFNKITGSISPNFKEGG